MAWRLRAIALLTAVGACLAGATASASAAEDPPFVAWNPLLPSLAQPFEPSRERDCVGGEPQCIEDTLSEMYRRFDGLYATCDHNAAFGITYIRVTEAIREAINRGFYEEPAFLGHEDKVFARMYFAAYDSWAAGRLESVAPAWREAFDSARDRKVNGQGNLLMSMNAHINRDMPFMLDALGLTKPDGASRKPDHDRGNVVLNTLYDDVLSELAKRFDPVTDDANVPGTVGDDAAVFQILQGWREQVWRHAEMLGAAKSPEQRRLVAQYIEDYALGIARQIKSSTAISDSSGRDAHCAAYRATHRETGGLAEASGRRARVIRAGRARVRVTCPGAVRDCAGTLVLRRRGRRLTRFAPVALAAGESRVVALKLNRRGRKASRRRLRVLALTSSPSPWGTSRAASAKLRLRR